MSQTNLQFTLRGFTEVDGCRVFSFEKVAADQSRMRFTVKADPALARSYGIRLQELPLLCRSVLDRPCEDEAQRAFAFTEQDMRQLAAVAAVRAAEAKSRKAAYKPPAAGAKTGATWRGLDMRKNVPAGGHRND